MMNRIFVKLTNVTAAAVIGTTAFLGFAAPVIVPLAQSSSDSVSVRAVAETGVAPTAAEDGAPKIDPSRTNPWD